MRERREKVNHGAKIRELNKEIAAVKAKGYFVPPIERLEVGNIGRMDFDRGEVRPVLGPDKALVEAFYLVCRALTSTSRVKERSIELVLCEHDTSAMVTGSGSWFLTCWK